MSIYRKKNNQFIKLNNYVITKDNNKYFICTRSIDSDTGIEYYDVPESAMSSFSMFASNTVYTFLLESNTTTNPKLRYGQAVLDIKVEDGQLEIGQLNGILQLYTKNVVTIADIYLKDVKAVDKTYTINIGDWSDVSNVTPFTKSATVSSTYTIGLNTEVELINDNAVQFANCGFSIASISGQNITIYAIKAPEAIVTLKIRYKEM